MERQCKYPTCTRPVLGRSDKLYCCDGCRSAHYNEIKKEKEYDLYTLISRIQKKNREMLKKIYLKYGPGSKVSKSYLTMMGYNFVYHTHTMVDYNGGIYQCCYDFAVKIIDDYWVEVSFGYFGNPDDDTV
ncbi:hypothetical protein ACFSKL_01660 [Belliella marina]|uniref:Uncharacterized protein n=1 Tax=Belliella marina TaxID=1644146 RepID=A0ABW4VGL3_9BACT